MKNNCAFPSFQPSHDFFISLNGIVSCVYHAVQYTLFFQTALFVKVHSLICFCSIKYSRPIASGYTINTGPSMKLFSDTLILANSWNSYDYGSAG